MPKNSNYLGPFEITDYQFRFAMQSKTPMKDAAHLRRLLPMASVVGGNLELICFEGYVRTKVEIAITKLYYPKIRVYLIMPWGLGSTGLELISE